MLLPAGTVMPSVPFHPLAGLILAGCALGHSLSLVFCFLGKHWESRLLNEIS